ncbi:hypothetical protein BVRB_039500 [Beta vulgaris subsp. vulgaris]|uniref:Uncharacterized protein n=1 Tax=Beta vulgaris subsp. vulgaris TaxID=3555 RepID=A0A0J8BH94_BETVV|nr:hypothetical protein BVRB_039500 [Beta vulgaris subsp. vulgaris]
MSITLYHFFGSVSKLFLAMPNCRQTESVQKIALLYLMYKLLSTLILECNFWLQFSNDNWSRKAVLSRRRKEGNIPLPDRPSLPDLSSVMRPDYPIGDSFDYDDFQPLIPNLKQPRQCSSMGNGLLVSDMLAMYKAKLTNICQVSCEVIAKPSALLTTPCSESLERQVFYERSYYSVC